MTKQNRSPFVAPPATPLAGVLPAGTLDRLRARRSIGNRSATGIRPRVAFDRRVAKRHVPVESM